MSHYGCLPWPIDYEQYVGLLQHLERVRHQRALEVLLGTAAAFKSGRLAPIWFDAQAWQPEEAETLEWETNSRRAEAAAMNRGRP